MTKKLLWLVVLTAGLWISAHAQQKFVFSAHAGAAVPIGDFAKKDFRAEAGQAVTGVSTSLLLSYPVVPKLRVALMGTWRTNGVDLSGYQVPGGTTLPSNPRWTAVSILGGLVKDLPLKSSKLAFQARLLAGIQATSSPEITSTGMISGFGTYLGQPQSYSAGAFAYLVGTGVSYSLSKVISFQVNGDLTSTNPTFRGVKATNGTKKNMSTVDVTAGLSFKL